jgi:TatD DNase family protein
VAPSFTLIQGMDTNFIDAHCHLTDPRVLPLAQAVIERALDAGVRSLMMGGVDSADWKAQLEMKRRYPEVLRTSFGLHPWRVEALGREGCEAEMQILESVISQADALGETGLDFHAKRDPVFFGLQEEIFRVQIRLAFRAGKPLVLHVVAAHQRALRILEEEGEGPAILVHSFSGSPEEAERWIAKGAILSFSGTLLREGRRKVTESLKRTPLDQLLLETDYPDQAWGNFVNEPALVREVYEGASQILGIPLSKLIEKTHANFAKIG